MCDLCSDASKSRGSEMHFVIVYGLSVVCRLSIAIDREDVGHGQRLNVSTARYITDPDFYVHQHTNSTYVGLVRNLALVNRKGLHVCTSNCLQFSSQSERLQKRQNLTNSSCHLSKTKAKLKK